MFAAFRAVSRTSPVIGCRGRLVARFIVLVLVMAVIPLATIVPASAHEAPPSTQHHVAAAAVGASLRPSGDTRSPFGIANVWELAYCSIPFAHPVLAVVMASRIRECVVAADLASVAFVGASLVFHSDHQLRDAYRHCIWSAWLTIRLGHSTAKGFLDRHEGGNSDDVYTSMDYANNEIGQMIGGNIKNEAANGDSWETLSFRASGECYDRASQGELQTVEPRLFDYMGDVPIYA